MEAAAELRTDVLTGRQVIVCPVRSLRPQAIAVDPPLSVANDPFLESREADTPAERLALRRSDSTANAPGWQVRVVPNRYPALTEFDSEVSPATAAAAAAEDDFNNLLPARTVSGRHDVVIECPDARTRLLQLTIDELTAVLQSWQLTLQELQQKPEIASVCVFRNEGFSAGASLAHCHSQIIAMHTLSSLATERVRRAAMYRQQTEGDLAADWLAAESADGRRIVFQHEWLSVLCPWASRTAWNVRLLPNNGQYVDFTRLQDMDLRVLARLLRQALRALRQCLGDFSFNLTLTLPPLKQPDIFRWMLDILPRTGRIAGFELLSDMDLIAATPESAAKKLRAVWQDDRINAGRTDAELRWQDGSGNPVRCNQ